jgi:hypothetical protein
MGTPDQEGPSEEPARACIRCGRPVDLLEYADVELCGDCYWDDQTNPDGTVGSEPHDDDE